MDKENANLRTLLVYKNRQMRYDAAAALFTSSNDRQRNEDKHPPVFYWEPQEYLSNVGHSLTEKDLSIETMKLHRLSNEV